MPRLGASWISLILLLGILWFLAPPFPSRCVAETDPAIASATFFESAVRPLLVRNCTQCHGPKKQESGLRLDSRAGMLAGGESGPAIVPGEPDESLLIEAIRYESFEMPPSGQLKEGQITTLTRWISLGAPWPDHTPLLRPSDAEKFSGEDRAWWAFQPLARPEVPEPIDDSWSRNEIDRFVMVRMFSEGLSPADEANPAVLARRLYFDLTGLPPSPKELAAFLSDDAPNAYERLVDTLLESPAYGERWARHWLDLVRYADSDGYRIDHYRPQAWRYRDYVIRSFNEDKPYDRFVQEQLAGDELFPGDPQALVATGYLRLGIYEYNNRDVRGQWKTILEDVTDTTADVFLAMGMQCAKCHDHKFDPILQKDYFRLQAFFAPLLWRDDLAAMTKNERQAHGEQLVKWEAATSDIRAQLEALEAPYRRSAAQVATEKFPLDIQAMMRADPQARTPLEHQLAELARRQVLFEYSRLDQRFKPEDKEKILSLRKKLSAHDKLRPPPLPLAMAATDVGPSAPRIHMPDRPDDPIKPGILTILDEGPAEIIPPANLPSTGRRSALARWLTRPDNPLLTRVITNRVWQYHFGRGLAGNASDFGRLGEPPTHPQLLDWLTGRFIRDGWSLKKLHRLIVTSATYRQSPSHGEFAAYQQIDPENRLYWRGHTRRLDAEQIRDALLSVAGQLSNERGGPGVPPDVPRRSIYTRYMRNARDALLDAFDLPHFFASESSRNTTTTPVQSLLLINSQQMLNFADRLATRAAESSSSPEDHVNRAWQLALGRRPTAAELDTALHFLEQQEARIRGDEAEAPRNIATGQMPYRDGQAVLLDPSAPQQRFKTPHDPGFDVADFTVEAYFQVRSIYETGAVRTLAAKWTGDGNKPGWGFGVTGEGSRRKPQTLVLQIYGNRRDGSFGEAAIFSDQHVALNQPYFAAAAVRLAGEDPGSVTFYLKDLSNDDEPLLVAEVPHEITGGFHNAEPITIGGRSGKRPGFFDGLIDDVRLSHEALREHQLLYATEGLNDNTLVYWQFEGDPGVLSDSSANARHLLPTSGAAEIEDPAHAALVDLCHALLNSNEFLYVQ